MHIRERPPLRLHVDLETPSGKHYRWGEDEPNPANVPSGLRFSDTMPGGFETCDCTLPRKPGIDYSDLERLSTLTVYGAGGETAGEYRLERAPRTSGDELAVSPSAVGWQAHLEDDKSAQEIYIDTDLTQWRDMAVTRRLALGSYSLGPPGVAPDDAGGTPALRTAWSGEDVSRLYASEAWYGHNIPLGSIYYLWRRGPNVTAGPDNFAWSLALQPDEAFGSGDDSGDLQSGGPIAGTFDATSSDRTFASAQFFTSAAMTLAAGTDYDIFWERLVVFGNHGMTKRGSLGSQGFWASDVANNAVNRWAPLLSAGYDVGIQPSGFVIPHLVFYEPTTAGEIIRQVARFGLQDWAVWEDKVFYWHDRGARGRRWRARIAPAELSETGPQIDRLWESVVVRYQDVDGTAKTVGPPGSGAHTESSDLKDVDLDNPANKLGIVRREMLQMGVSTAAGATEIGRRFLEETKLLDRSGQARLVGHVEDDRGVLHPYWKVRAGDYISFVDAADTSYRRIVKTDKDHPSRTCSVDLDAPPEGLQALLERLGVVLVPLGL